MSSAQALLDGRDDASSCLGDRLWGGIQPAALCEIRFAPAAPAKSGRQPRENRVRRNARIG